VVVHAVRTAGTPTRAHGLHLGVSSPRPSTLPARDDGDLDGAGVPDAGRVAPERVGRLVALLAVAAGISVANTY